MTAISTKGKDTPPNRAALPNQSGRGHRRNDATDDRSARSGVLERICNLIVGEGLKPGMKLPAERALAAQLQAGRPAVREAIKALGMLDVLASKRGDGTYVKSLAGLSVGWPVKLERIEEDVDLIELYEVRKILEPRAASLAASRVDDKQLREIEREFRAQETHSNYRDILVRYDHRFHEAIVFATGNKILAGLYRTLSPLLVKSRRITSRTTPEISKIIAQHRTILEAIRLGQPELAERAMKEHLDTVAIDLISQTKR